MRRTAGTTPESKFIPKEVYVQGFYDWSNDTGAIDEAEVDDKVEKLLSGVPKELSDQFTVDKQYPSFRRICFVSTLAVRVVRSCEACWQTP